jgi:hypothetical protein
MRAHNNQPKVSLIVVIFMVEAARRGRAMTIGEDAVPSFRPSDFEAKKYKTKFVMA